MSESILLWGLLDSDKAPEDLYALLEDENYEEAKEERI